MKHTNSKRTNGFTVTEVMIALGILSVVSLASLGPMVTSIRANGDNRTRAKAVIAGNIWLDRFRGKTLNFANFTTAKTYPVNYDYANDPEYSAAATDPNLAATNEELQPFKYTITTAPFTSSSITPIWKVTVVTTYKSSTQGGESNFTLSTLTQQ
jgi:prepilin-type N-terminal cleavage/methylation domain-containing protein